jgi:hypothetical protein
MNLLTRNSIWLCALFALVLFGQAVPMRAASEDALRRMEDSAWEEATEGLDYEGEFPEAAPVPESRTGQTPWVRQLLLGLGYALLIGLMVALLWLVYRRLSPAPVSAKVQAGTPTQPDDPGHLLDSDLEAFLAEAWREERYRDVLRFQFLALMRALSQGHYIDWKPEKTNRDYERELASFPELRQAYRQLSRVFEWSRYGEASVSREDAEQWSPHFRALEQQLRSPMRGINPSSPTR